MSSRDLPQEIQETIEEAVEAGYIANGAGQTLDEVKREIGVQG